MSYQVKYTTPTGETGRWSLPFATRGQADAEVEARRLVTGYTYTVEEVPDAPEPTKTRRNISYVAKWFFRDGRTAHKTAPFATREDADKYAKTLNTAKGYTYTVEEVPDAPEPKPEPGSTAAHHVEILRTRVNVLEALVEARGKAVADAHVANLAMHRDLALALQLGDALRHAVRTGEWRAGHDRNAANSARTGWDRFRPSLGKAPSAPEAPGEGGDSDQRRLEALERFLDGKQSASIAWWEGEFSAVHVSDGVEITAPTLAALADKLAEKEGKP